MSDVARRFDDVLMTLAGQAGSVEALLGVFFSFLHRKTDFYITFDPAKTAKARAGFPLGRAEQVLLRAFRSFPHKPDASVGGGSGRGGGRGSGALKDGGGAEGERRFTSAAAAPTATTAPAYSSAPGEKKAPSPAAGPAGNILPTGSSPVSAASSSRLSEDTRAPSSSVAPSPAPATIRSTNPATAEGIRIRYTKDGKQIPIGNGGVTPRYYWTQTVKEATVYVDVPPGTRSKDVSCVIQPRRLKLKVRGAGKAAAPAATAAARAPQGIGIAVTVAQGLDSHRCEDDEDLIFDGELPSTVSREDSMWTLNDGKTVVISFEKTTKSWWKSVVEGDPEIDTSQVDSTTKISEYDGETQGTIRKIMFDQRQKTLGLPTSDELNAATLLDTAKGLPGSPFLPGGALFEGGGGVGDGGRLAPNGGDRDPRNP